MLYPNEEGCHVFLGLNKPSLAQYGIHKSTGPIHKNYSTPDARLRSFALWPVSLKQKPDVLSDAGFYYTGKIIQVHVIIKGHAASF